MAQEIQSENSKASMEKNSGLKEIFSNSKRFIAKSKEFPKSDSGLSRCDVLKLVLNANNFEKFNPMQEDCIKKGLNKSMVVCAPTASGKTIIAELFMLQSALNERKKVIYTCPLRALASEHYNDFKKKYSNQGSNSRIKFVLSTGDLDSNSSYLKNFDVVMTTYEKLASLLRHKAEWLSEVGTIIIDEMHELDSDRGPVLEIALTQLRINNSKLKVLGLSATIPNSKELSDWLDANLVESNFRPTKLKEGVLFDSKTNYNDLTDEEGSVEELVEKFLNEKKQILIFMNARKRAESMAKKITEKTKKILSEKEKIELNKLSSKVLNALESPTEQCHTLSKTIEEGAAFHHAGLVGKQREIVEDNFRKGLIKILCATPTLAAGVNTPADIVLIPSLYRFEKYGMDLIRVREYKQMVGRAGRPKYSTEGKGIIIATADAQKELFTEKFINGEIEQIISRLGIIPILRTHILALIASDYIRDIKTTEQFFENTLYAVQLQNMGELLDNVVEIIDSLEEFGFVQRKEGKFYATQIGKRVSDLFLDPESAYSLIQALKAKKTFTTVSYLYAWASCLEFSPWLKPSKKAIPFLMEELSSRLDELPVKKETALFESEALEKFFSSMMLKQWVNEKKEQDLFKEHGLAPGTLFGKTQIIEWLSYSTIELSKTLGLEKHLIPVEKLGRRVKYGVKEELLLLVELKGVGRVRARKLFNAGIKKPSDLLENRHKIEAILGKAVSDKIFEQIEFGGKRKKSFENNEGRQSVL